MKHWWQSLAARERALITYGSLAITLTLLWFYGIKPYIAYKQSLQQDIADLQQDQSYLQRIAKELPTLRANQPTINRTTNSQPLQRLLEPVLKRYGLDNSEILKELSNTRAGAVNLHLNKAPFDKIARLLGAMELQYNAKAIQLSISPESEAGMVTARITLKR